MLWGPPRPSVLLHVCADRVVPPEPAEARHDHGHDACKQGGEGGASQLPPCTSTGEAPASKLVCLANLLSEKALADDAEFSECVQDIRAECAKFGRIETFVVPRERALEGRPASDVGKCFIAYADEASAARSAPPPLSRRACHRSGDRRSGQRLPSGQLVVQVVRWREFSKDCQLPRL